MKNLLTQWELRRKTDHKLEPRGLLLLGFLAEAVKWPSALLPGAAGPSRRRSNHRGLGPSRVAGRAFILYCRTKPSEVEPSWVETIVSQAVASQAIAG